MACGAKKSVIFPMLASVHPRVLGLQKHFQHDWVCVFVCVGGWVGGCRQPTYPPLVADLWVFGKTQVGGLLNRPHPLRRGYAQPLHTGPMVAGGAGGTEGKGEEADAPPFLRGGSAAPRTQPPPPPPTPARGNLWPQSVAKVPGSARLGPHMTVDTEGTQGELCPWHPTTTMSMMHACPLDVAKMTECIVLPTVCAYKTTTDPQP